MALFKISKGLAANLPTTYNNGYCYVTTDDHKMYIDTSSNSSGRFALNAAAADKFVTARTINGTSFDGTANIITSQWGATRNIYIQDADGTNKSNPVAVNGSAGIYLELPSTIKAALTGNADTATTLQTTRNINGMNFNGSVDINNYGVCSTAAATAAKVVTIGSDFVLKEGATVRVKFTNNNTVANPTLNVNGTGAKPIMRYGTTVASTTSTTTGWYAGAVITLTYDGTNWVREYWYNNTYTYLPVYQYVTTTNGEYPLLLKYSTSTATTYAATRFAAAVTLNPSTGNLTAPTFTGNLIGNADKATNADVATKLGTTTVGSGTKPIYLDQGVATAFTSTIGSTTQPTYLKEGAITACSTYAGGTAVTLNGTSKAANTASFYAPTATGTSGQYLKSNGAGAPTWATTTVSNTWTAGTTAGPTIKTTVNGVTGTAVAIPSASSSASGILTTGTQTIAGAKTFSEALTTSSTLTINGGIATIYRSTSIANNYPATLQFKVYQTDNAITNTGASIKVYDDHDAATYGTTMVIQSSGNMIIGGGEAPNACYTNDLADSTTENTYIVADGSIYFYTNCNTYSSKKSGVYINTAGALYGAVWNDYAEYRDQLEAIEPGYCVTATDSGKVYKTTEKFQACDGIVSDTFGFAIGQTDTHQTPLAVAGRVLAYCDGNKNDYHFGDVVCAGPKGLVYKMTEEEIIKYPHRIVGTVSEIPDYEIWGSGNIKVNGRIWIKVV